MKTAAKIVVVMLVSLSTWAGMRSILAQQGRKKAAAPEVARPQPEAVTVSSTAATSIIVKNVGHSRLAPIELDTSGFQYESHMRSFAVAFDGDVARVQGHLSIADHRPGKSYVWRLRSTDDRWQTLAGHLYTEQVFAMDANGRREIDFDDIVPTPPGTAHVELEVVSFSKESDLESLDDKTNPGILPMSRAFKSVSN